MFSIIRDSIKSNLTVIVVIALAVLYGLYTSEKTKRIEYEGRVIKLEEETRKLEAEKLFFMDELRNREAINANIDLLTSSLNKNFGNILTDMSEVKRRFKEEGQSDGAEVLLLWRAIEEAKDGKGGN